MTYRTIWLPTPWSMGELGSFGGLIIRMSGRSCNHAWLLLRSFWSIVTYGHGKNLKSSATVRLLNFCRWDAMVQGDRSGIASLPGRSRFHARPAIDSTSVEAREAIRNMFNRLVNKPRPLKFSISLGKCNPENGLA